MGTFAGEVLILAGAPGCGKTTAARTLSLAPDRPGVHLHADMFWGFVGTGRRLPVEPGTEAFNATVLTAVAGAAEGFAGGGFFTVVDCVIGPWAMPPFGRLRAPLHYAVLRLDPATAIARCQSRTGDALKDPDIIAGLHAQFADLGPLERHVLDVNDLGPEEVVDRIENALAEGRLRLSV